jgi:hypothetical protein
MTYELVVDEYGPQPYSDWNPDSLFDADRHERCRREDGLGQFLCARRLFVIRCTDTEVAS